MRNKLVSSLVFGALLALLAPGASADICYGCSGGGSTTPSNLNRISVSNAFPTIAGSLVLEGEKCDFTIRRLKPRSGITRVRWHTKDGTAKAADGDYSPGSGIATFNAERPGQIHVLIQTNFDSLFQEGTEHFFLVLGRPSNGDVVDASGRCDIQNQVGD